MALVIMTKKYLHECGSLVHFHQHTEKLPLDCNDDDDKVDDEFDDDNCHHNYDDLVHVHEQCSLSFKKHMII